MKKSLFLILSLVMTFSYGFVSCSDDNEKEVENIISVSDLPAKAQTFLTTYFRGYEVEKVQKETVNNTMVVYEVELEGGYSINFNSEGEWTQVEAPYGKNIPTGFIPEPILQTLDYQYHGYGITEINTTGQNYHLVLGNNQGGDSIELIFNQSGEIVSTGDM